MTETSEAPQVVHSYSRGPLILGAAAESFGVPASPEQLNEWRNLIETAYVLDNILDGEGLQSDREAAYDTHVAAMFRPPTSDVVIALEHQTLFANLRESVEGWSYRKVNRIASVTEHVKEIALAKREATTPKRLGNLALHEGTETARFLELSDPNPQIAHFNAWLKTLLRFGVTVDSAVDLPEDYDNDLTKVLPTKANQLVIASFGAPSAARIAARTPAQLYRPLFAAARAVTNDTDKDSLKKN